ncbi:MAG: DUF898 family protein [Clostridia bacterium]|nr:DUF898 family protein [Clostridia bacterium]
MICPNCRANVPDGSGFCTNCGTKLYAAAPGNTGAGAGYTYNPAPGSMGGGYAAPAGFFKNSTWDGGVFETFVNSVAASLICALTCSLGTPWAICYMLRYIISHTVIDGKRYRFDGHGGALFGNYLVWTILTVITCGIYGFWVTPKFYNWIVSHIHVEE